MSPTRPAPGRALVTVALEGWTVQAALTGTGK
jgi:hypothetical protein